MLDINTLRFEVKLNKMDNSQLVLSPLVAEDLLDRIETAEKERDDLLAKVEEITGRLPYGAIAKILTEVMDIATANGADSRSMPDEYVEVAAWLCGVPGAQPAPSVPDGWKLVPTAESRHPGIYKMLGALHTVDNTPGASEWESYAAFLAAAPEAKP